MGLGFWGGVGGCFVGGWRGLGGVAGRVMVAGFGVVGMTAVVEVAAAAVVGTGSVTAATAVADIVVAHMNFPILVSLACIANSADYRVARSVDAVPLGVGNPKPLELAEQNSVYFGMLDLCVDLFHIVELSVERVIVVGKAIGRFAGGTFDFGSCSWVFWVAAFAVVAIAVVAIAVAAVAVAVAVAVVVFAVIVAEVVWVAVFEDSFEIVTAVVTAAAAEMAAEGSLVEIAGIVIVVIAAAAKVQVAVLVVLVAVLVVVLVVVVFGDVDTFALAVADKPVIVVDRLELAVGRPMHTAVVVRYAAQLLTAVDTAGTVYSTSHMLVRKAVDLLQH
jgi:hypothetical protein